MDEKDKINTDVNQQEVKEMNKNKNHSKKNNSNDLDYVESVYLDNENPNLNDNQKIKSEETLQREYQMILSTILDYKKKGNLCYHNGKLEEAQSFYSIGESIISDNTLKEFRIYNEQYFREFLGLKRDLKLNSALINFKLKNYAKCKIICDEIIENLDPVNSKAYYRRGMALKNLESLQLALKDLQKVHLIRHYQLILQILKSKMKLKILE